MIIECFVFAKIMTSVLHSNQDIFIKSYLRQKSLSTEAFISNKSHIGCSVFFSFHTVKMEIEKKERMRNKEGNKKKKTNREIKRRERSG